MGSVVVGETEAAPMIVSIRGEGMVQESGF